jgi:hypothetical protein
MPVKDDDKELDELLMEIGISAHVQVGFFGSKAMQSHEDSKLTVVEVAAKHEFGEGVPRRSMIVDWFDENERANEERLEKYGLAVLDGKVKVIKGMDVVGLVFTSEMRQRMHARIPPPLSEETLEKRKHGGDVPLIDTGQMVNSLSHLVGKGDGSSRE